MELKPALTYDEQVVHLRKVHNLTIEDSRKAIEILKHVNYYRLSGYGIGLKQPDDLECYRDGITLSHIYKLYCFDSALRNLLIHLIEQLEIQLRTQIAYLLAIKYGPEGYMDVTNFDDIRNRQGKSIHEIAIENFKKECSRQKNIPFVKHHNQQYQGHFPIWVAIELFSFGSLASLYSILKMADKKSISSLYDTKPKYLTSWILALVEVRNICAHYVRLYNMPLKQRPRLFSESKKFASGKINRLFPLLITLKRMVDTASLWDPFEEQLEQLIDTYEAVVQLPFIGFPPEWKTVLRSQS